MASKIEWTRIWRVGKKKAGRELDGREWNQMPETSIADGQPLMLAQGEG